MSPIDSSSMGDPARHLDRRSLDDAVAALSSPRDAGTLCLLLRRGEGGLRDLPQRAWLSIAEGLPGDAWGRALLRKPQAQLAVTNHPLACLIANGQPLGLFGDNLFVDLDLSTTNLPPGSRLAVGDATVEVTPKPHSGCRKYKARFGADALRFAQDSATRDQNRRGIYWRVVVAGEVWVGAPITVLSRTVLSRG